MPVVASFPARKDDHLMLVTNQAKLIRMGLDSLRVIGRKSAGVRLFNVADNEHVVSAAKIEDDGDETSPMDEAEEIVEASEDRKSGEEGKSGSGRGELGGRRNIKKKKT